MTITDKAASTRRCEVLRSKPESEGVSVLRERWRRALKELEKPIERIWEIAERLRARPVPDPLRGRAGRASCTSSARTGLPGRFSHWTHGKAYQRMKTMYDYGLSKIYELVINTDPCYAFLMEGNSLLQNKLVAAHVLGHADFFKNNAYFRNTNRQMVEGASVNAERIRRYEFEHGRVEVEQFLDAVLSIQEHVDPYLSMRPRDRDEPRGSRANRSAGETPYDDLLELDRRGARAARSTRRSTRSSRRSRRRISCSSLAEHSRDLEDWQRDVLQIVRNELLYFVPQMQTKIMNEGWASYWHREIMRELGLDHRVRLSSSRNMHAGVLAPSQHQMNPYYVGLKIFEVIERRWDNPTEDERRGLGRQGGEGRAKIFEVRETESDVSFLRNYLTQDLVDDLDLYIYKVRATSGSWWRRTGGRCATCWSPA